MGTILGVGCGLGMHPGARGSCCEWELRRGGLERCPCARGMVGARAPGCLFWRPLRRRVSCACSKISHVIPLRLFQILKSDR